jgi:hypothetical protein
MTDLLTVKYPTYWLDPVEINGRTPPLMHVYEDGSASFPTPLSANLGTFGENAEGAVLWTCVGYVRVKHVSEVVSRPIALRPSKFVWLEWFVGPVRR